MRVCWGSTRGDPTTWHTGVNLWDVTWDKINRFNPSLQHTLFADVDIAGTRAGPYGSNGSSGSSGGVKRDRMGWVEKTTLVHDAIFGPENGPDPVPVPTPRAFLRAPRPAPFSAPRAFLRTPRPVPTFPHISPGIRTGCGWRFRQ